MLRMEHQPSESSRFSKIVRVVGAVASGSQGLSVSMLQACFRKTSYSVRLSLRCWKLISFKTLLQVCTIFWGLSKTAQDALLWSMQSRDAKTRFKSSADDDESSDAEQYQVRWSLAGRNQID